MPKLQPQFQSEINKLQQNSGYIVLYIVDGSAFGGPVYRLTNHPSALGGPLVYAGFAYQPMPVLGEGFDSTASGTMAKPTLTIGNVGKTVLASVLQYGDMVGWPVTRIRVFEKYLDTGSVPNTAAHVSDKWLIEKLVKRNATGIQWQLTTELDRMSFKAGRQILKDPSVKNVYAPGVARTRVTGG